MELTQTFNEPSEGQQCLWMFCDLFLRSEYSGLVTSAWAQKEFVADPTSDWANYRGRGPINQWGIKHIVKAYGIRPGVIHPRGRAADRGYKIHDFEKPFRHYLGVEIADILAQRRDRNRK